MSKHKDKAAPLADWEVHLTSGSSVTVAQAWYERTKGDYVFHDETGVCYTFPVFSVTYIRRVPVAIGFGGGGEYAAEPAPQVRVWTGTVGSGGSVAWRGGDPVEHAANWTITQYNGGHKASCRCGLEIVGVSRESAKRLIDEHVRHPGREPAGGYSEAAR